jgi:8-oxo-dGTP pyrophosphatase MutT (NUDIX family)
VKKLHKDRVKEKVQVWIYFRDDDQIKVLTLKLIEARGGHWQPVTGSIEPGETAVQGAAREAYEESSLPFIGKPLSLDYDFSFETKFGSVHETCFAIETAAMEPVKLDPREHLEYRWLSPEEARSLIKFASNQETLDRLVKKIKKI